MLYREPEAEVFDVCESHGVGFLPFFPLESGLLTGKVSADGPTPGTRLAEWPQDRLDLFLTERNLRAVQRLSEWLHDRDQSLLDLAFSWLLSRPHIPSVIAGATSASQVFANSRAAGWQLSENDLNEIDDIVSQPMVEPRPKDVRRLHLWRFFDEITIGPPVCSGSVRNPSWPLSPVYQHVRLVHDPLCVDYPNLLMTRVEKIARTSSKAGAGDSLQQLFDFPPDRARRGGPLIVQELGYWRQNATESFSGNPVALDIESMVEAERFDGIIAVFDRTVGRTLRRSDNGSLQYAGR